MDAVIEAPAATATVRAPVPLVVAIVVVPDYVPAFIDQGVVTAVPTVNGTPISAFDDDDSIFGHTPRLSSRGVVVVGNGGGA